MANIALDKAELLSVLLESLLYGFSLLMFIGTIWALVFQRSTDRMNHTMVMIACALLLLSTAHLVIHIIRVMYGLILYRDTYQGGPDAFFADSSEWTFVAENFVYVAQTLIGDAVVIYRCYAVWQSKIVMILPVLLWCGLAVTGIASPSYLATRSGALFDGQISNWITAFWALALSTNLLATFLLAGRIWYVDHKARRLRGNRNSQLRPILRVILDAGMIYSFTVFVGLICFVTKTNGQYVVLDMVAPIISITFYMVIVRVGLAKHVSSNSRAGTVASSIPLGFTSSDHTESVEQRRALQVHVSKLTESRFDNDQRSPVSPTYLAVSPARAGRKGPTPHETGFPTKFEEGV